MNEINTFHEKVSTTEPITMSSREIADLTGKEHRNVMADIRKMLVELHGAGGVLNFQQTFLNTQNGQQYPVFNLPYRETMILVTGYSVSLRAKVVDRWQELEKEKTSNSLTLPNFTDPVAAALAWADAYAKKRDAEALALKATEQLALAAPKVEFYDQVTESENWIDFTEVAKALNVGRTGLYKFLRTINMLMSGNLPYQREIMSGHFKSVVYTFENGDGSREVGTKALCSGKGLTLIKKRIDAHPETAKLLLRRPKVQKLQK